MMSRVWSRPKRLVTKEQREMRCHVVERTSPKGEGMPFIGRCLRCSAEGLGPGDALVQCPK